MRGALEEFFARVEDEFAVRIGNGRELLGTPGDVVDFLLEHSPEASDMEDGERREHILESVGELMAESLGVTRYREDSRFVEDLRLR